MGTRDIVLVNNSRETFTPTGSGAIATCLWEAARAAADAGDSPVVLTRTAPTNPYPWPHTQFLMPSTRAMSGSGDRTRRQTGRPADRRAYARTVIRNLAQDLPRTVVCNDDPELADVLARRFPRLRVVHWFHHLEYAHDRWRRDYPEARVRSVAVSDYLARAVEREYALEPGTVELAHPGVDTERFRPTWLTSGVGGQGFGPHGPQAGDPVVLGYLGGVTPEKAPDAFLQAALLLAAQGHDIAVQLLGDTHWGPEDGGPYGTSILELLHLLTAEGVKIHAPGHVARDDVPSELRRAHVHVVPSAWDEPFGLTTLEGMASGLATVATATGGTPEIVAGAGVLVPRSDPTALAEALTSLITDPERLWEARRRARRRAETFAWSATWAALRAAADNAPLD